jgi:Uma2 family endonuclease
VDPLRKDDYYTYDDYLSWDDGVRYELIDGVVYMMSPAPNRAHQMISRELSRQFSNYLKGKKCEVYAAPFDVRLNNEDKNDTVVQPDITVVCDPSKLDDKGCVGAPDMVLEILSPSTSSRDKTVKFKRYLRAGVREYWIVDPMDRTLTVHILDGEHYRTATYGDDEKAPVHVLEDCIIDLAEVFGKEEEAR